MLVNSEQAAGMNGKRMTHDSSPQPQLPETVLVSNPSQATDPYATQASVAAPDSGGIRNIGDYELLEEIARGGMGVVYKARHVRLGNLVAVKLILAGKFADAADIERFQLEAKAAAQLDHPGIVPVHQVGEYGGYHFLAMAYVDGQSLWQRVQGSPLKPKLAARLIQQVAEAMHHAHEQGIVHRDLKPQNILLTADEQPKVTDFGLAKNQASDPNLTAPGAILGTPSYMPPEQASGKLDQVGQLADVYSLGATLYCLLMGRPPFQAASVRETLNQVIDSEPVAPRQLNRAIDRDLEKICLKCLEKDPHLRYRSAADLAADLQHYLQGEPVQARRIGLLGRVWRWGKRKPVVAALGVTALLAVCAVAASMIFAKSWNDSRQLRELARQFESGLDQPVLAESYLADMEQIVAQIASIKETEAADSGNRLYGTFAVAIRERHIHAPRLNLQDVAGIRRTIDLLGTRDSALQSRLHQEFEQRLASWETLFELETSFENVADLGLIQDVQVKDRGLRRTPADAAEFRKTVSTAIRCPGEVRCEVQFAGAWKNAHELGVVFTGGPQREYGFLLSVDDRRDSEYVSAVGIGQQKAVYLQILRNGAPLRVLEVAPAELAAEMLRFHAQREGDLLTIQINDLAAMSFVDVFPLATADQTLEVVWPAEVAIERLTVQRKLLPLAVSLLEQGDDLFGKERFAEALASFRQQLNTVKTEELAQEVRYKIGLCLLRLKRHAEALGELERLSIAVGARWPILASLQLWTDQIERRRMSDADVTIQSLTARYQPEQIAQVIPAETSLKMLHAYEQMRSETFYLTRPDPDFTVKRERLIAVQELLKAPRSQIIQSKLWLLDEYLEVREHLGRASQLVGELSREPLNQEQLLAWHSSLTDLLIRTGEAHRAPVIIGRSLYDQDGKIRQDNIALLVIRSRANAAAGQRAAAQKDIDEFFSSIDLDRFCRIPTINGLYFCQLAFLLKGFYAEDRGNQAEARDIWKTGFQLCRKQGEEGSFYAAILGSLSDSITREDADQIVKQVTAQVSAAGDSIVLSFVRQRVIPTTTVVAVLRNMWQSQRGRTLARRFAFSELDDYQPMAAQLLLTTAELMRSCVQGTEDLSVELLPEDEDLIWNLCRELFAEYQERRFSETQFMQVYLTFTGNNNALGWQSLAPSLKPEIRGPLGYIFGWHYRHLKRDKEALEFFRNAVADAPEGSALHQLATAELQDLPAPPGYPRVKPAPPATIQQLTLTYVNRRGEIVCRTLADQTQRIILCPQGTPRWIDWNRRDGRWLMLVGDQLLKVSDGDDGDFESLRTLEAKQPELSLSSDGRKLAWQRTSGSDAVPHVIVEDLQTPDSARDLGFGYDPYWTDDGDMLVFLSWGDSRYDIGIWNGESIRRLSPRFHETLGVFPVPSPDGKRIAFGMKGADNSRQIGLISVDGTNLLRQLTRNRRMNIRPAFSPDGRYIAYLRTNDTGKFDLAYIDVESEVETLVTQDALEIRPIWRRVPQLPDDE